VEKVAQKIGYFSKQRPKIKNSPIGENSPNLVTLAVDHFLRFRNSRFFRISIIRGASSTRCERD
jgi:hypothetical protein